jgi:cobalt/nickel transport protein
MPANTVPDATPATGPAANARPPRGRWVNVVLLLAVVALFAVPLGLRLNAADAPEGESYAGTDSTAVEMISEIDPGYESWFSPWFEPSSGEIESGLFALQAALGAGAFGFAMGRLSGRRRPAPGSTS